MRWNSCELQACIKGIGQRVGYPGHLRLTRNMQAKVSGQGVGCDQSGNLGSSQAGTCLVGAPEQVEG